MLPKRKLIKKQYTAPQTCLTAQSPVLSSQNLLQQLQSEDPKVKSDAISAIANINMLTSDLQQQLYSLSSLIEIVKILTTAEPALVQTTLFAINNLCMVQTQGEGRTKCKIVNSLFNVGLDQALLQLNSGDSNLIKPILILMGNIAEDIPAKHKYLLAGIQNTLIVNSQKYLKLQPYYDLVLQFLMNSSYTLPATTSFTPQSLTPQQLHFIKILQNIGQLDKMYKNRAMASRILINMTSGKVKQCIDLFCNNFEEFMQDIDLEKQYQINFQQNQKQMAEQFQQDIEGQRLNNDQEQDHIMQQLKNNKNKAKNNKNKFNQNNQHKNKFNQNNQHKNNNNNKQQQIQPQTPYTFFIDALQGIQVILQFIVQQLEDQNNFADQDEQEQEEMNEEDNKDNQVTNNFNRDIFLIALYGTLNKIVNQIQKFTALSFVQGQNIIQLFLRMLLSLPDSYTSQTQHNNFNPQTLIKLTQQIIVHQFKHQIKTPHIIPQQVFIYNFKTALQIIIKYKLIINRNIYIQIPYLKYQNTVSQNKIIKINKRWKQCWINLLQIYSLFYNPQKIPNVTENENKNIGGILKKLIIEIPEIQLQQWRGQAIDTLFDIYSNQNFDGIFMQYGFVDILSQVLKVASGNSHNKAQKKSKKSNKFINAVLSDIQRFIAYKKKMIGF